MFSRHPGRRSTKPVCSLNPCPALLERHAGHARLEVLLKPHQKQQNAVGLGRWLTQTYLLYLRT